MFGIKKGARKKIGSSPGTLIHVGEKKAERIFIRLMRYDEKNIEEKEFETIEECYPYIGDDGITWVNIDGLHDIDVIKKIGENRNVHPLVLEDILNTHQPTKMDDFDDYLFIITKMFSYDPENNNMEMEQLSLILGKNYVITFQEHRGDIFNPVRERIRTQKGRIRKMGADYLAYALMDIIVDYYFVILDKIGEKIEALEDIVISEPRPDILETIHYLKKDIIFLRKSVWPLREMIMSMERNELNLIEEKTTIFFRDLYDHTIQVIETIETFRDLLSGMQDLYLSSISNKMNEIMKVLTIIATIFIPITFIAGIYGMNFKFMPELDWPWGYPLVWLTILITCVLMILYFKRKKWL